MEGEDKLSLSFLDVDGLNDDEKDELSGILRGKGAMEMTSIPVTSSEQHNELFEEKIDNSLVEDEYKGHGERAHLDRDCDSGMNVDDSLVSGHAFPDLQEPFPAPYFPNNMPPYIPCYPVSDGQSPDSWHQPVFMPYYGVGTFLHHSQPPLLVPQHYPHPYHLPLPAGLPLGFDPHRPPPNFIDPQQQGHTFQQQHVKRQHHAQSCDSASYKSSTDSTGTPPMQYYYEDNNTDPMSIKEFRKKSNDKKSKIVTVLNNAVNADQPATLNASDESTIEANVSADKNCSSPVNAAEENCKVQEINEVIIPAKENGETENLIQKSDPCDACNHQTMSEKNSSNETEMELKFGDLEPELRLLVKTNNNNNAKEGASPKSTLITNVDAASISNCVNEEAEIENNISQELTSTKPSSPDHPAVKAESVADEDARLRPVKDTDFPCIPGTKPAVKESTSKSWAGLFKRNRGLQKPNNIDGTDRPKENSFEKDDFSPEQRERLVQVADTLLAYKHSYQPYPLRMRGLCNKSNWCYVNATLQALLSCSAFVRLLKNIPSSGPTGSVSPTPIADSLIDFLGYFESFSSPAVLVENKIKLKNPRATPQDLNLGVKFEPESIYEMLRDCESQQIFKDGRQEDAEEFLSFVLNKLHDEFLAAMKLRKKPVENGLAKEVTETEDATDNNNWEQVMPKNKSIITRHATVEQSPIMDLFGGVIRSAVRKSGEKDSATLQPFFTLQLDIQPENVNSVRDALEHLASKEVLTDVTSGKTNQQVEATRRTTLEHLPPILILHLKAFVYQKNGGSVKVCKNVDFDCTLEISKELLSSTVRQKYQSANSRRYNLFAVIGHHGEQTQGGHYSADVYHKGLNCWLKADDEVIRSQPKGNVFKQHQGSRIPYILYYERIDAFS
ncbi:DgyrCDS6741 [Dimorphilus gyrociliatus]|uniref:ubiquitinyl hydrolase 1 n=1 Tax=Dimorphilus gyrociliatus TaxID=2664684 RepID=A0A7I8VNX7_9ANNE|nr:DgyrCDS6741 [Dimorphilus gyrociliatus]